MDSYSVVLKAMGRSVGTDAKPKQRTQYAEALELFKRGEDVVRTRRLLESVAKKSRDRDLAADADYLLIQLSGDSAEAKYWLNRLRKRYPDHPNLLPAKILYDRIQRDLKDTAEYDPILGGFVLLPGDSTGELPAEMQSHEVTREEWGKILGSAGISDDSHPEAGVEVGEISRWLDTLNQRQDVWHYRLPTVREWSRALGDGWPPAGELLSDYAWHKGNSCEKLQRVAVKQANALGLHDLLGNVAEWCLDQPTQQWRLCGGSMLTDSTAMVGFPVESPSEHGAIRDVGFRLVREKKNSSEKAMK